jgi:predicted permease
MSGLVQDIKYAIRLLIRHRGFTAIAVLVLALGIGANTAAFTLINAMLFKPRQGVPASELAGVYSRDRTTVDDYRAFSYPNYADLRDRKDLFVSLAAHNFSMLGMTEGDMTRRLFADVITSNYFDTFGVRLALGRPFTAEEERPGADIPVVILGHTMWQRLGGSDALLNTTVQLNNRAFTVVGVAPRGFGGSMAIVSPEVFVPTGMYDTISNDFLREGLPATLGDRRHHSLILIARLAPGQTIESLEPALTVAGRQLEQAFPGENQNQDLLLASLSRMSVSTSPQTDAEIGVLAVLLFSMSGLVLLVASFNLANMLLARGRARQKEFAIRLAIGGTRLRLVRQLVAESLVLALLGGIAATFVAWWTSRLLTASMAGQLPLAVNFETAPDIRIVGVTMGLCLVASILFGLGPALRHARTDAVPELKDQAGDLAGRRRRSRFATRNVLVMGQLALSLVTLTAAGMFVRSALESAVADPGFTFDRGILVNVDPGLAGRSADESRQFYERALARVRAMPGVASASIASLMPFGEFTDSRDVQRAGAPLRQTRSADSRSMGVSTAGDDRIEGLVDAVATAVGADYFATIGLPLVRGREFPAANELSDHGDRLAIIDTVLAARLFGDEDPIGQLVQWQAGRNADETVRARVIGLVPNIRHQLLDHAERPHLYTPTGQDFRTAMYVHARTLAPTAEAEAAMLPDIRRELRAADAAIPIMSLETRPMFRERNLVLWLLRTGASLFVGFGVLALFMSVVGVYGVKSYVVARRTREIGIRVALGATPSSVVRLIVGDGFVTTAIGLVAGLALSVLAGSAIRSLLIGDGQFDVAVIGSAIAALALAATAAAWLPARRATRIMPTRALRTE